MEEKENQKASNMIQQDFNMTWNKCYGIEWCSSLMVYSVAPRQPDHCVNDKRHCMLQGKAEIFAAKSHLQILKHFHSTRKDIVQD